MLTEAGGEHTIIFSIILKMMDKDTGTTVLHNNKRNTFRIFLAAFLIFLGVCVSVIFFFFQTRNRLIDLRKSELTRLVNLGYQAVLPYINGAENGFLSKEDALSLVRGTIRKFTYDDIGGKNYLFMSAYDGTMLVQPFEPHKEGTSQWDLRDSRGTYIIRELIKAAKKGKGFVEYWYPAPGSTIPMRKVSYVIGIDVLDCYLGTGLYMADVLKISGTMAGNSAIIIVGVALFLAAFFLFVYRPFTLKQQAIVVRMKAEEEAAFRERHLLKQIIDNLPGYAFFKDVDGKYITANRLACDYINLSPEEIEGKNDYDLFPAERAELYKREDRDAAEREGEPVVRIEKLSHAGRDVITSKRTVPVRDERGDILGI